MAYNPKNPMEDRISDIGPRHYGEFLPPMIKDDIHVKDVGMQLPHNVEQRYFFVS